MTPVYTVKSMTGFGRAQRDSPLGQFTVEIRTVNNRFVDIGLALPREFTMLESPLRALLKDRIARGKVDVRVRFTPNPGEAGGATVNAAVAGRYVAELSRLAELGVDPAIPMAVMTTLPGVIETTSREIEDETAWAAFEPAVLGALDVLDAERRREGDAIARQLAELGQELRGLLAQMAERQGGVVEKFRERLFQRINDLLGAAKDQLDPGRLEQEVTLFADKADIAEEIVRLGAHLDRYDQLLSAPGDEPVGKNVDFLVQEFNREVNTMCSKTRDTDLTQIGLAMKSVVERIREQIQNVE